MTLSEAAEARIRGYLYVLRRSLPGWLPAATVADAVREVESHIREKAAAVEPLPDERAALERILEHLGSPARVAAAYATEMAVDEAVASGRVLAIARALGRMAGSTATGFLMFLALFTGYAMGLSFLLIAAMKPLVPDNVGLMRYHGRIHSFGINFGLPPGTTVEGGYSGHVVALRSIGSTRARACCLRSSAFARSSALTSCSVIPSYCR